MTTATTTKKKATPTKAEQPAKIIYRIKGTLNLIIDTSKKVTRQKNQLYMDVYLYVETVQTKWMWSYADALTELVAECGRSRHYWCHCFRMGKAIRDNRLDPEGVRPSSLIRAFKAKAIKNPAHLKKIAAALNSGVGPTEINKMMTKMGYASAVPIRGWHAKEIRKRKKKWTDWEDEVRKLLTYISKTTDKQVTVHAAISVDSKQVLEVTVP